MEASPLTTFPDKRAQRVSRFVDDVPETLDPGSVYVSIEHATMVHLYNCVCGAKWSCTQMVILRDVTRLKVD